MPDTLLPLTLPDDLDDLYCKHAHLLDDKPWDGSVRYQCECYGQFRDQWAPVCKSCGDTGVDQDAYESDLSEWERRMQAVERRIAAMGGEV